MGLPLNPIIATIIMNYLLDNLIANLSFDVPFFSNILKIILQYT